MGDFAWNIRWMNRRWWWVRPEFLRRFLYLRWPGVKKRISGFTRGRGMKLPNDLGREDGWVEGFRSMDVLVALLALGLLGGIVLAWLLL